MKTKKKEITLYRHEKSTVSFQLKATGFSLLGADVRFVIDNQDTTLVVVPGTVTEDNKVSVEIPASLKLPSIECTTGKLEVIVRNRYFCPIETSIIILNRFEEEEDFVDAVPVTKIPSELQGTKAQFKDMLKNVLTNWNKI